MTESTFRIYPGKSRARTFVCSIVHQMLGECGLCLALDDDKLESNKGGVLTTATAMGMPLIERMRSAGMTFQITEEQ